MNMVNFHTTLKYQNGLVVITFLQIEGVVVGESKVLTTMAVEFYRQVHSFLLAKSECTFMHSVT